MAAKQLKRGKKISGSNLNFWKPEKAGEEIVFCFDRAEERDGENGIHLIGVGTICNASGENTGEEIAISGTALTETIKKMEVGKLYFVTYDGQQKSTTSKYRYKAYTVTEAE